MTLELFCVSRVKRVESPSSSVLPQISDMWKKFTEILAITPFHRIITGPKKHRACCIMYSHSASKAYPVQCHRHADTTIVSESKVWRNGTVAPPLISGQNDIGFRPSQEKDAFKVTCEWNFGTEREAAKRLLWLWEVEGCCIKTSKTSASLTGGHRRHVIVNHHLQVVSNVKWDLKW